MPRKNHVIVSLLSLGLLALELVWTRLFSAEFFYTYAFLIISLTVMGLGLGALAVRLIPGLERDVLVGPIVSLTGLAALAGPVLVFRLGLNFSELLGNTAMVLRLIEAIAILSAAYVCGGAALASLFRSGHRNISTLYMADLLGAGLGVIAVMWLMNRVGTPVAAFLSSSSILFAALVASRRWWKLFPSVLAAAMLFLVPEAENLLQAEREERAPVIYKHWDALAKLKLYDFGGHYRGLNIDNVANSPVYPFDGNFDVPDSLRIPWGIDVSFLIQRFDSCTFMSLGAGGGTDVLQALFEGATRVDAVEVNPHINRMMLVGDPDGYLNINVPSHEPPAEAANSPEGGEAEVGAYSPSIRDSTGSIITLADYSGGIYRDPRVRVISEDARTYVKRHKNTFDLIFSLSSNTWAALASGSFALAESYLFTKEAFRDYWEALSENGFLSMEHQVYMPRIVSAALEALLARGIENPESHIAVYDLPRMRRKLLLLSKQPLTERIRNHAYGELTPANASAIHLLYPAPDSLAGTMMNQIVENGWRSIADSARVDVSPTTDDRPFIAQMGLWRNLRSENQRKMGQWAEFYGFPLARATVVMILVVVAVFALPLMLSPYAFRGRTLRKVPWLYFFVIGVAFMGVEVVLIQKFSLFLGASVYSIATVLVALLVSSALGSRLSPRFRATNAFGGIVVGVLLHAFVVTSVTERLGGLSLMARLIVAFFLVSMVGFFMGMPFPKGARRVEGLVDWGFAVNGTAGVVGATGILLVAFSFGFTAALVLSAVLYLLASLLFRLRSAWG